MKPVKNSFSFDSPMNLQEEFVGMVVTEGSVESLPVPVLWGRGRMPPSGMISEGERQTLCRLPDRAYRDIEGLFESLLSQSFDGGR